MAGNCSDCNLNGWEILAFVIVYRPSKPVSRPVVRNIRNDEKSNRHGRNKGPKRNVKSSDGRSGAGGPSNKGAENKAPVKAKVDTGRKPKEEKPVDFLQMFLFNIESTVESVCARRDSGIKDFDRYAVFPSIICRKSCYS